MTLAEARKKLQKRLEAIELLESLSPDQLETVKKALLDDAPSAKSTDKVPCPEGCGVMLSKNRKPTLHYQYVHPNVEVPGTL